MKSIALFLLAGLALTSCQKELHYDVDPGTTGGSSGGSGGSSGGSSTYYIKGKKDGTAFSFSANTTAIITDFTATLGAGVGLALVASPDAAGMEMLSISIVLSTGNTVPTGTYSESNNLSFSQIVTGTYIISSTNTYAAGVSPSPSPALKVVIQNKTSSEISGTFEGAFYKPDGSGGVTSEHITFTEGEFKLPLK